MFNVEQLPFLYTLGYAIGHSLWQMSLVWLAYTGISAIKKWNSAQRYNLAVLAAATGFLSFIISLVYFSVKMYSGEVIPTSSLEISTKYVSTESGFFFFYHSLMGALRSLAPYFSCAYILVMMLLIVRLANGFKQVDQLKTKGIHKAPVDWRLFVNDHAGLLGIAKKVSLHVSSIATSPLTLGFVKPIILIPLASINHLSPQQLEAVLLHELAHIKRNDYLVNIFLQVAEIVLFFNPFMRLVLKQARIERENCCDDYVLQFRYNAADYAKALLSIEQNSSMNMLALGTNNKNEFQLLNRVKRMLSPERRAFNYRQQLGLLFLLTLITLCFTVINPAKKQKQEKETAELQSLKQNKDDLTFESAIPSAIQFVKNLERLGNNKANNDKTIEKHVAVATTRVQQQTGEQLQKHLLEIQKASQDIEKIANNFKGGDKLELKLEAMANQGWMQVIAPAINEGLRSVSLANRPIAAIAGSNTFPTEKQLQQIDLLQKKIDKNAKKIDELTRLKLSIADSLHFLFSDENLLAVNNDALKKAKKEMDIAPFRVWKEKGSPQNFQHDNFSMAFSPKEENAIEDAAADEDVAVMAPGVITYKNKNCQCPKAVANNRQVIVIDGKQIADKVKKVWNDAQQQMKDGWSADMQQKIVDEIQHELQGIQNVQIKTQTNNSPAGNARSFVIEVHTEK